MWGVFRLGTVSIKISRHGQVLEKLPKPDGALLVEIVEEHESSEVKNEMWRMQIL